MITNARMGERREDMKYRKKPVVIEAVQFDGTDESCDLDVAPIGKR